MSGKGAAVEGTHEHIQTLKTQLRRETDKQATQETYKHLRHDIYIYI